MSIEYNLKGMRCFANEIIVLEESHEKFILSGLLKMVKNASVGRSRHR